MSPTDKGRGKIMNLLELVSAITRDGYIATGIRAILHIGRLFSSFPSPDKGEKGWKVKKKGEVATDIRRQAFYFLIFIQCIKNKVKIVCRKTFSDLWHTVSNAQVLNKNQL